MNIVIKADCYFAANKRKSLKGCQVPGWQRDGGFWVMSDSGSCKLDLVQRSLRAKCVEKFGIYLKLFVKFPLQLSENVG